jgi:hypothetical protein
MRFQAERLQEADRSCLDSAELLLDALDDLPSPVAFRNLTAEITRARNLARSSEPATRFQRLLLGHLEASWGLLEQVVRFRFEWPGVSVSRLLDALAGPGSLDRLESTLADLDQEQVLGYLKLRHGFRAGRVSPDAPEVRPFLERAAADLIRAFRAWLEAREGTLPGTDAEVVLGPSGTEHAWYEPARHRVVLAPAEFMVFEGVGHFRISPIAAARSLAHELAGHAVQNALSRDLPESLRPDHRARLRFAALPATEGFADHRAALAAPFLEAHRSEFDLTDREIEMVRQMTSLAFLHHALPACLCALAARAQQERGFDPVAYLAKRVGHSGFGEALARTEFDTVNRVLYKAACYFGLEVVQETAAAQAAEGLDAAEAVRRLGRGGWALSCYREAVLGEDEEAG